MESDIDVDDAESAEYSGYLSSRQKALMRRKPTSDEALTLAMLTVKSLLEQEPKPDVIKLMTAASEHVDTFDNSIRAILREYIVELGGSLAVSAERMHGLFYPPNAACRMDNTWPHIVQEEPNEQSIAYNDPAIASHDGLTRCRFPVGVFRPFAQSENLCCGQRFRATASDLLSDDEKLVRFYCPSHRDRALRRGTATSNYRPAILAPAHRANYAAKNRKQTSLRGYDG